MPSDPYSQAVLADSPLGFWRLDETPGAVAYDSSGNGNNATITGGVTLNQSGALVCDPSEGAMVFDGSTGSTDPIANLIVSKAL